MIEAVACPLILTRFTVMVGKKIKERKYGKFQNMDEAQLHGKGAEKKQGRRKVIGSKGARSKVPRPKISEHISLVAGKFLSSSTLYQQTNSLARTC